MTTTLIIGASGTIGSRLVRELDAAGDEIHVRLATSRPEAADQWRSEGRDAVVVNLDHPDGFADALRGVDRVFLLTGYSANMLYQSKMLVDAAADNGVGHIVHLGVFSSGRDRIPHYAWHELIETYIKASGLAWTHLHPNVITESILALDPPISETGTFAVRWKETPLGWVAADDIAAVAATVLREGPAKHGGVDYWLSTEVITGPQAAEILSDTLGMKITCQVLGPEHLAAYASTIPEAAARLYLESAVDTMRQSEIGNMAFQAVVRDDVAKVLGRPGITVSEWAKRHLTATR